MITFTASIKERRTTSGYKELYVDIPRSAISKINSQLPSHLRIDCDTITIVDEITQYIYVNQYENKVIRKLIGEKIEISMGDVILNAVMANANPMVLTYFCDTTSPDLQKTITKFGLNLTPKLVFIGRCIIRNGGDPEFAKKEIANFKKIGGHVQETYHTW